MLSQEGSEKEEKGAPRTEIVKIPVLLSESVARPKSPSRSQILHMSYNTRENSRKEALQARPI
jgi:hypothetical protein